MNKWLIWIYLNLLVFVHRVVWGDIWTRKHVFWVTHAVLGSLNMQTSWLWLSQYFLFSPGISCWTLPCFQTPPPRCSRPLVCSPWGRDWAGRSKLARLHPSHAYLLLKKIESMVTNQPQLFLIFLTDFLDRFLNFFSVFLFFRGIILWVLLDIIIARQCSTQNHHMVCFYTYCHRLEECYD